VEAQIDFGEGYLPLVFSGACLESAGLRFDVQASKVVKTKEIPGGIIWVDSVIDLWMGGQRRLPARNGLWARTQKL